METDKITCLIKILKNGKGLPLPYYATEGAAGMDIHAAIDKPLILKAGKQLSIPTGLELEIPEGYEVQIRPRSGLANDYSITVINTPGTIDWDYRGEIKVMLINLGDEDFAIKRGDRIAQMVFAPITLAEWVEAETLSATKRGAGGFGSTGGGSTGSGNDA